MHQIKAAESGCGSRGVIHGPVLLGHKPGPDQPWLGHLRECDVERPKTHDDLRNITEVVSQRRIIKRAKHQLSLACCSVLLGVGLGVCKRIPETHHVHQASHKYGWIGECNGPN